MSLAGNVKLFILYYRLSAPFLRGSEKEQLICNLDSRYAENPGECLLFDWIEIIKDHLQTLEHDNAFVEPTFFDLHSVINEQSYDASSSSNSLTAKGNKEHNKPGKASVESCCDIGALQITQNQLNRDSTHELLICPEIYTGNVIEDRKSVFQGHFARVDDVQNVRLVLDKLLENKKIKHATHPTMYAYRIQQKGNLNLHYETLYCLYIF